MGMVKEERWAMLELSSSSEFSLSKFCLASFFP